MREIINRRDHVAAESRFSAPRPFTLTLYGAPRTKKNSPQLGTMPNGRPAAFPSKAWRAWVKTVKANHGARAGLTLPDIRYNCAATFYRDRDAGDANGYYQGLADLLETWKLLSDDKWIVSWDGSRMAIDRKLPRVVFTLTPVITLAPSLSPSQPVP